VRESQEVVELALKGLLRATGARDSARLIVKLVRSHVPAAR
jgi:HEPN domain-containing protein